MTELKATKQESPKLATVFSGRGESTAVGESPYNLYKAVIICMGIPAVLVYCARFAMECLYVRVGWDIIVMYPHSLARLPACFASFVGLNLNLNQQTTKSKSRRYFPVHM